MHKQPDVRARTRQNFIDAFWTLCKEHNVSQITVGELVKTAGYNRSTFYEYFTDMPDLIHQVEDELLEQIRQELQEAVPAQPNPGLQRNFEALHLIFRMLSEPMYFLLGPNGDPSFHSRIKETVLPIISKILNLPQDSRYFDYIVAFAYSAAIGFMQHWREQGQDISEQEFYQLGFDLIFYGVVGALGGHTESAAAERGQT